MNTIYTFGDGFAAGHIWPEWPQILQALFPNFQVINTAAVGTGPEWLVYKFVQLMPRDSIVIFQWPQADRFDKLIEDLNWENLALSDPVYNFNLHDRWWLTSASNTEKVREYHRDFIQKKQHALRLETYKELVKNTLENNQCRYMFTSTEAQNQYTRNLNKNIRLDQIQPGPVAHLYWLKEVVIPTVGLECSDSKIHQLENLLLKQEWIPFYFDQEHIWSSILKEINLSNT